MANNSEEKLRELTLDVVHLYIKIGFFNLVCDLCDYSEDPLYQDSEEIKEIKSKIFALATSLEDLLGKEIDKRESCIEEINKLKDDLANYSKSLFLYSYSQDILYSIAENQCFLKHIKEENLFDDVEEEDFLAVCLNYIEEADDDFEATLRKSRILSCLPMKMPAANYSDYLRASFSLMLDSFQYNIAKASENILKEKFLPLKSESFGSSFPEIADKIREDFKADFTKMNTDELENYMDNIESDQDNIYCMQSDYGMYFNDLNYLLNILSFSIDADYLTDDDLTAKDIFYSLKNLKDKDDLEIFSEPLNEKAESCFEAAGDKLKDKDEKLKKHLSEFSSAKYKSLSQQLKTCLTAYNIVSANHLQELSDVYSIMNVKSSNDEICTKQQADEIADDFIEFVSSCKAEVDLYKFKELKRIFMKSVPCPLDNVDFMEFVENSVDENSNNYKDRLIYAQVLRCLDSEDFSYSKNDGCEHHDHSCDCGCSHEHDHEHNHSCSCSHEHH